MTAAQTHPSLVDAAYEQVRRRILDNAWPPGHRALEQEVALALGMSGMRVLPVSPTDMQEIYEILTALECLAAEIVARRGLDEASLAPLVQASEAMDAALRIDDLDAWARADEQFHAGLVELSGNRQLQATVWNYWDRAHRARMFSLKLRPKPEHSTREHMQLVERLRAADPEGAARVNRAHRERSCRELLAIFERYRLQQM